MTKKLFIQAMVKYLAGVVLVGVLIFLPAGTFAFFNGWLLMGVMFVPMFLAGIVMMFKNAELLKIRLKSKERQKQKKLLLLCGLMFLSGFIVAGLGVRFGLYMLPLRVAIIASGVFLVGYILYAEVLRENKYLSRTIEVQENQTVVDTGLYGVVRHPMYSATLLLFLSVPFILGSVYSLPIFLTYPFIIVLRIKDEEEFLEKELDGYSEYMKKVKYRIIPFVW